MEGIILYFKYGFDFYGSVQRQLICSDSSSGMSAAFAEYIIKHLRCGVYQYVLLIKSGNAAYEGPQFYYVFYFV